MKQVSFPIFLLALAGALVAGCHSGGAYLPKNTNKYSFEDTEKFVLLDPGAQRSVTCTGIQEQIKEDGRLEVIANVRNRENRRIEVQINCEVKNDHGFGIGDQTPFQTLILTENAQESVRFISMNNQARKYTIRVRQAR